MTIIRFQESIGQQASRLNVSPKLLRNRRKTLLSLLENKPLPPETPQFLQNASDSDLLRALALTPEISTPPPGEGDEPVMWLTPSSLPPARSLLTRYYMRSKYTPQLRSFAVPDLGSCRLPYGYQRRADGAIIPEPDAAAMVRLAFAVIVASAEGRRTIAWEEVTRQINARGSRRSRGKPWVVSAVRDLTRITSYAGYIRLNAEGLGDAVELLPEIAETLIDLDTFVKAARVGPGKNQAWLRALEDILMQSPESPK